MAMLLGPLAMFTSSGANGSVVGDTPSPPGTTVTVVGSWLEPEPPGTSVIHVSVPLITPALLVSIGDTVTVSDVAAVVPVAGASSPAIAPVSVQPAPIV